MTFAELTEFNKTQNWNSYQDAPHLIVIFTGEVIKMEFSG